MMNTKLPQVLVLASSVLLMHISGAFADNMHVANASVKCIERERQSLLSLKQGFVDPYHNLSSWGNGENQTECCEWEGVQCSNQTGHVVKIDLGERFLEGTINPSLADLHHLNYLDLRYNNFSNFAEFLKFIASLTHLKHLDLSCMYAKGKIPFEWGGLFHLQYLDLSYNELNGDIPTELGNLSNLVQLNLDWNELSGRIPHQLGNLSNLQLLGLRDNQLNGDIPAELGNLSSLVQLDLSSNKLSGRIPHQLGNLSNLQLLGLSQNFFIGTILDWVSPLTNLRLLQELYLGGNQLEGGTLTCLFDLCRLQVLDLSDNNLSGRLEESLPTSGRCAIKSLKSLYLSNNQIAGSVPDLSQYSSLQALDLGSNQLNGSLSSGIGELSSLEQLIVGHNSLKGVISETHFLRLFKLRYLDLSFNELIFNFSREWVPPFQLGSVMLASCKLGPTFPIWLQTQKGFGELDVSSDEISDTIPDWFWEMSPSLIGLNLSHNQIRGQIPDSAFSLPFMEIDLSSNLFDGPIPPNLTMETKWLDLSNNKFTDAYSVLCPNEITGLWYLDLSSNQLFGELPDCWNKFTVLEFLSLANNSLHGKISPSMGFSTNIQSLHLENNRFVGEIPLSLNACTKLRTFDVSQNHLSGLIPGWLGRLENLIILSLRSNLFFGSLPSSICQLSRVQILDLSSNKITGSILSCLNNLTALATPKNSTATITYIIDLSSIYNRDPPPPRHLDDSASLVWKGKESIYKSTLGLVRSIDLSSNMLSGKIPSELMDLVGLVSLNISRNMITGEIPTAIGRLKSLDFLDLSRNRLSGRIPTELSQIDRLGVLDLSYNNLSGEIPLGTQLQSFNGSAYMGNAGLCGAPLSTCPTKQKDDNRNDGTLEDNEQFLSQGFYISLTIGFSTGFWGVCSALLLKKSWRYAYFKFVSDAYDKVYVVVVINVAKFRRRMNRSSK